MFIEVRHGDTKILVSVERINYMYNAGEKTTIVFGGGKWITVDESYEEIVQKIAEGEGKIVVATYGSIITGSKSVLRSIRHHRRDRRFDLRDISFELFSCCVC